MFTCLAGPIAISKVCAALKRMANDKTAGPSGITSDALKSMVCHEEELEDKENILVPVPKSGNLSNPNKWRPVCLLGTSYKLFRSEESMISQRMSFLLV
eukprot:8775756-Ditylum_brightwellii.AAC.2